MQHSFTKYLGLRETTLNGQRISWVIEGQLSVQMVSRQVSILEFDCSLLFLREYSFKMTEYSPPKPEQRAVTLI